MLFPKKLVCPPVQWVKAHAPVEVFLSPKVGGLSELRLQNATAHEL